MSTIQAVQSEAPAAEEYPTHLRLVGDDEDDTGTFETVPDQSPDEWEHMLDHDDLESVAQGPVVRFPVEQVIVGKRLRSLRQTGVEELAESMNEVGLLHPITITEHGHLISGLHRLEAAKLLEWTEIDARLVDGGEQALELLEIDENLVRKELTVLERGEHLKRRKELYESLHPESKHGFGPGRGRTGQQTDRPMSFADDTASRTNVHASTVRRDVRIAQSLPEDVRDLIRSTPTADSRTELQRLMKLKPEQQKAVAKSIAEGTCTRVTDALRTTTPAAARAEGLPPTDHDYMVENGTLEDLTDTFAQGTADLIVTRAPARAGELGLYAELARFGSHILRPGGSLLVIAGQSQLPELMKQMDEHLIYHWTLAYFPAASKPIAPNVGRKVTNGWRPVAWFTNGDYDGPTHSDIVRPVAGKKADNPSDRDANCIEALIAEFCSPGNMVCDPFVGDGLTAVAAVS